ncbi:Hypothetical_protein [Hexamita inflata]|uniref:Hypothetical_protein n=1 Tax=Hexamita inflata TaxID=28002 RepID=A0AA86P0W5_9EUKA|nr:Hypothetical protein HINF_LOCUS18147 [Hexamita inflata]
MKEVTYVGGISPTQYQKERIRQFLNELERNPAFTPCNTGRIPYGTYNLKQQNTNTHLCCQYIAEVSLSRVNELYSEVMQQEVDISTKQLQQQIIVQQSFQNKIHLSL